MGETVLYSSVKFKKGLRQETTVTQDEDVTYAEVRSSNPTSSDTVCPSAAAERSAGSSHPYRRAAVCVGLLCVLLLTATLVLCALHTNQHQKYSQLQTNYTRLNEERHQLQTNYTRLNEERDQLQRNYNIFQKTVLKKLLFVHQYCHSSSQKRECKPCPWDWVQSGSKCYFFSTESKIWTESRNDCIKRGADLVIIKSKEEQDFISGRYYYYNHWIGLSDTVTEGTWLWVDGSPLQGGFWREGDPNDQDRYRGTDCVAIASTDKAWIDTHCKNSHRFICETDDLFR